MHRNIVTARRVHDLNFTLMKPKIYLKGKRIYQEIEYYYNSHTAAAILIIINNYQKSRST